MKTIISVLGGLGTCILLLLLMTKLIAQPELTNEQQECLCLDEDFQIKEEVTPEQTVQTPQPPSASIEPSLESSEVEVVNPEISLAEPVSLVIGATDIYQLPELSQPTFANGLQENRSAMAIFQPQPKYPLTAQIQGVEGWVKLTYDVNPQGRAVNIRIIESSHKLFKKEAKQALKRWKFKAPIENGIAVALTNQTVLMEFNFEKEVASQQEL